MNSRYIISLLGFTVLLMLAIADCTPIAGESDDGAAAEAIPIHGDSAPIDGHVRVKRGISCSLGKWACAASCYYIQNCGTGYCPDGSSGICRCSRCANGRGSFQG